MIRLITTAVLLVFVCAGTVVAAPRTCESLAGLQLADTTITSATTVSGALTPPSGAALDNLPAFCRVVGVIRPSSDSHIEVEVWLPSTGWNGKLQGVGNGGFAGTIAYDMLANAVRRGYAAAATDTGHKGGATDARWALGHPEKIVDFGHRAIHEMTVKAKAVAAAFYGAAPRRAYFAACSNGGRQGLMEAQRHPDDYDGIVAGAPAAAWTRFMLSFTWNVQALGTSTTHIPPSRLPAIQKAVVAACDARDRVPDGVIATPARCTFDPGTLACTSTNDGECLSAAQVEALAKVYAGPRTRSGAVIARGFPPGAETGLGGWAPWITGAAPGESLQAAFANGTLRYMAFGREDYDLRTFDFERDPAVVEQRLGRTLNATDPDLSAFHTRGGKLILFHGWNDPALSAHETVDYFESVRSRMGSATDAFARLYLIAGLQHCFGGPGATYTGGHTVPFGDAEHDLSAALERWVEEGIAPGAMVATPVPNRARLGDPVATGPRRRICAYPEVDIFRGTGSPDDPTSWACTHP
jgi:feruloyl esterase